MGSLVVVTTATSLLLARGISVPPPGIKPVSPASEGGSLTTGPRGKSLNFFFFPASNLWALSLKILEKDLIGLVWIRVFHAPLARISGGMSVYQKGSGIKQGQGEEHLLEGRWCWECPLVSM